MNRRDFLRTGAGAAALLATRQRAYAFAQSPDLPKFIQPLRGVGGPGGIPVAVPDSPTKGWWQPGVTHYTIDIGQFTDQLHPDLPNPTRLWGFGQGPTSNFKHLGGIIAAKRGTPGPDHLPQQPAPHAHPPGGRRPSWAPMGTQNNRADIHLHGGFVPWISDGGPHAWWDPNGNQGPSFREQRSCNPARPCRQRGRVLLSQQPERAADVVPRPRLRHHAPQCLRGDRLGLRHLRRL